MLNSDGDGESSSLVNLHDNRTTSKWKRVKPHLLLIISTSNLILLTLFIITTFVVLISYSSEIKQATNFIKHFNKTTEVEYIIQKAYDLSKGVNVTEVKQLFEESRELVATVNPVELKSILKNTTLLFKDIGNVTDLAKMIVSTESLVKKICHILKCDSSNNK